MFRRCLAADTGRASQIFFLVAIFFMSFGRNSYNFACSWLLVASGHGTTSVAVFFAVSSLTELVTSPIAGWLSDRYDRRNLSTIADITRLFAALLIAAMIMVADLPWMLWLSTIVFSGCDRLSLTATQSMIPSLRADRSLARINSIVFVILQIGSLASAAIIGFLLQACSPRTTLFAIAGCFCISAACGGLVHNERRTLWREVVSRDISLVLNDALRRLAVIYALLNAGGILVSVVGPSFVWEEHLRGAMDFGHLESAWSAGSILGVLMLIPVMRFIKLSSLHLIVLVVMASLFAATAYVAFSWNLLVFAMLGAFYNLGRVSVEVALQACVAQDELGRAKGTIHSIAVAVSLLLVAIVSLTSDDLEPSTMFLMFSGLVALSVSALASLPVQRKSH
ncbi:MULTISPECIES: MFS transporter [Rhizobium/Agrobacterium group]|uniref:MFS transporter n=2 Tax=Rhizobium/Agrobacterium group TaxID=227290 RepID=UPI0009C025B8|nr:MULTISPECIES: MFS transporter [Rhizobium/Agrobacterium group]MCF1436460.1 MFS transporter [Allorhizobium ampelinum]MCF1464902.1 MFS transporter [Allorhizobium ampelinum]MCF1474935.1 MFS transporter [Allorhizobium ampelinum]MCF1496319.1 MFS transporter [Allorhizobium ampelinum]MUO91253.1 MFS transporter [Agrobacterium vitis]